MSTKCIYTFIVGDYDNLKEPKIYTPDWDYICVTDNPNLKSDIWQIIQIDEVDKKLEPAKRRAMSLMIGYRKYLPKHYDIVVTIPYHLQPVHKTNHRDHDTNTHKRPYAAKKKQTNDQ